MIHHPEPHTAKPPRTTPALAWSNPAAEAIAAADRVGGDSLLKNAHAVRIPDAMLGASQADRLARVLAAMEAEPAVDFDVQPRTERMVLDRSHQPVARIQLNGWLYYLPTDDARLLAACLRADPEALGGNARLTDLVAQAITRACADAIALAEVKNAELTAGVA